MDGKFERGTLIFSTESGIYYIIEAVRENWPDTHYIVLPVMNEYAKDRDLHGDCRYLLSESDLRKNYRNLGILDLDILRPLHIHAPAKEEKEERSVEERLDEIESTISELETALYIRTVGRHFRMYDDGK